MALPDDWANIDWSQSVIILPSHTEGIRTEVLNSQHYPQFGREYYMMAQSDADGPIIYYNASEIAKGGPLVSQFVFWHEMGHITSGHASTCSQDEVDADLYSFNYWISTKTRHGVKVIESAIYYLQAISSPGDALHPPSAQRAQALWSYLKSLPWSIVIYDDNCTPADYVASVLQQGIGLDQLTTQHTISVIETFGSATLTQPPYDQYDSAIDLVQRVTMDAVSHNYPLRLEVRPA